MTYMEKLRDPRWQKKRLEVLNRAGWKCQCCERTTESLQIHHLIYSKGEPWEAPDENLECLCESCHEWRTDFDQRFHRGLAPTRECAQFVLRCKIGFKHWRKQDDLNGTMKALSSHQFPIFDADELLQSVILA